MLNFSILHFIKELNKKVSFHLLLVLGLAEGGGKIFLKEK